MPTLKIDLSQRQYLELEKIALGTFAPLTGFMSEQDFASCVDQMRLTTGAIFPIPVVLDVSASVAASLKLGDWLECRFQEKLVGRVRVESLYRPDRDKAAERIYGTREIAHPGVKVFMGLEEVFVGGQIELLDRAKLEFSEYELTPDQTRALFRELGWKKIVGFQTRNVPHRAHEYLQKCALEIVDGVFLQPLVGQKKPGDFAPLAVIKGYAALIEHYYPKGRARLGILSTNMRYAGPREAVFHAIIRRNYGCTHFIVGRDHAGVGGYYDKYAAHRMFDQFPEGLGIEVLRLHGPYLCNKCDGIVTEQTCPHYGDPAHAIEISGTWMRRMLVEGQSPDPRVMRAEVLAALKGIQIFTE